MKVWQVNNRTIRRNERGKMSEFTPPDKPSHETLRKNPSLLDHLINHAESTEERDYWTDLYDMMFADDEHLRE